MTADDFIIRSYQRSDEDAVIRLWLRCGLTVPWNNPQRDIERKLQVQPELFLVGLIENRIVATAMGGYDGHRGWINYLGVDPDYRRRGLAQSIMNRIKTELTALGCPKINLQIRAGNASAIAFYQSIGFRQDDVLSMGFRMIPDQPETED